MQVWEIVLLSLALSMDACTVAMTDGMTHPTMPKKKALLIGFLFGFFQFLMPVIGFFITGLVTSVFMDAFQMISGWVSFALLGFLGGRMLIEGIKEMQERKREKDAPCPCISQEENAEIVGTGMRLPTENTKKELSFSQLIAQAIATSIDALAVGVTLQMAAISEIGLSLGVWGATGMIGVVTFALSFAAVYVGKLLGSKLADKASVFGGLVLVGIGLKLLIESLL